MDNENNAMQKINKPTLEELSKDELLAKYKDVLTLAKKAKKAKDEIAKENVQLKVALEKSANENKEHEKNLMNMQEVVAQFIEQKLVLTMEISEFRRQQKSQQEEIEKRDLENLNLKKQLQFLLDENEVLLGNVKQMETQLEQVNSVELHKYKELKGKYDSLKDINSGQREKLHLFRDRFKDVQEKLRKLQICKKVLLETQHEYADAVSAWQSKIVKVSQQLCNKIDSLTKNNKELTEEQQKRDNHIKQFKEKLNTKINEICYLITIIPENQLNTADTKSDEIQMNDENQRNAWMINLKLEIFNLQQQLNKEDEILKTTLEDKDQLINTLKEENMKIYNLYKNMQEQIMKRVGETFAELRKYKIDLQNMEKYTENTDEDEQVSVEINKLGDFTVQQQETIEKLKLKLQQTEEKLLLNVQETSNPSKSNNDMMNELLEKLKKENEKQRVDMKNLEQEISHLKANNEKFKGKEKQTNMLNLEIEAAEKTLKELRDKLVNKTKELENSKLELQESERSIENLKQELELVKIDKLELYENEKKLKLQIYELEGTYETAKLEQRDLLLMRDELEKKLRQLTKSLENKESEYQANLQKQGKSYELVQQKCKELESILKQTNINFNTAQQRNITLQKQLDQIKEDYDSYKLKAQTVFNKQQNNNDKVKLLEVERQLDSLEELRKTLENHLQFKQQENIELQENLEIVMRERSELHVELNKLQDDLKSLKVQNQALQQQQKQQMEKQQEALQQQRLHIKQLKESHEEEIKQLMQNAARKNEQQIQIQQKLSNAEQARIDINLMEREAAEGSEAIDVTTNIRANNNNKIVHDFMPLDELLSASIADMSATTTQLEDKDAEILINPVILAGLEKKEQHIKHLSSLLAESEQDLAKITQMNDMLKEELRRQERAVERQEHMQNSEYLKNVVFKFLTLNNIDERMRLVPVMSTILKLSRQEMEVLNNVAKGLKTVTGSGGGWNFLPWSSGNN